MSEVITKIITETLASGIEPLQRSYKGVYDGYDDRPVAYLTETAVFTTETGVLTGYEDAINENDTGRRWSLSNITAACRAIERLAEGDKHPAFLTAAVTKSFLEGDVAKDLADLEEAGIRGDGICLLVNEKDLAADSRAADGVAEARSFGYKTAIYGYSGTQSLLSLTATPADYVFLAPEITALAEDHNKPGLFTALTTLLRSLRTEIILCGVKNDDTIRDAIAAECFGVVPDPSYEGEFAFPKENLDIDTILSDEENEI